MSDATEQIRSRGYWRLVIRPDVFEGEKVPFESLSEIIRSAQVRMRGWNFPQYREPLQFGPDWVGCESRYEHHIEAWRLYSSGQFVDLDGLSEDWRDASTLYPPPQNWAPGRELPIWQPLFRYTEFFEFASRLALSPVGDDVMHVRIEAHGLAGRKLVVDDRRRAPLMDDYVASIDTLTFEQSYRREELVARARVEAVRATRELLLRFGWTGVTEQLLLDYQRELTKESAADRNG